MSRPARVLAAAALAVSAVATALGGCGPGGDASDAHGPRDLSPEPPDATAPTCGDGRQNQDESDIDCGGALCSPCGDRYRCSAADDCTSGLCIGGRCVSCIDRIRNADETDIDCGGGVCDGCVAGKSCRVSRDCAPALGCSAGACRPPGALAFAAPVAYPLAAPRSGIAAGDFNGDHLLDLATTNDAGGGFSVALGKGKGIFAAPVDLALGASVGRLAAADFDLDGCDDLVFGTAGTGVIIVLGGPQGFATPRELGLGQKGGVPLVPAVGDFDGDRKPDIVVAAPSLILLLGDGKGGFPSQVFTGLAGNASLAAADLDGDGHSDVVTARGASPMAIYLGAMGALMPGYTAPIAGPPYGLSIGDVDGDARPDIALIGDSGSGQVFLNRGPGQFLVGPGFPVSLHGRFAASGDFDWDSYADVVVACDSDQRLEIDRGDAQGALSLARTIQLDAQPSGVVAADFNGDGRLDIAASFPGSLQVLLNTSQ